MYKLILALGIFILQGISLTVYAQETNCDQLQSVQNVLSCALQNHPDIRQSQIGLEQGKSLQGIARQRPNPELSSQDVIGNSSTNGNLSYMEFNLSQTLELGGKRKARIQNAKAETNQRKVQLLATREQVYIKTLLSLYRIQQIQTELGVLKDSLKSFDRIEKQYRARSALNPEQKASLSIFEIASSDYQLRKAPLEAELDREKRSLEFTLGRPFNPRPELLPKSQRNWPKIEEKRLLSPASGSEIESARAELNLAKSKHKVAQSNAWPDLKAGPTFLRQPEGASNYYNAYGVNFTLPLPLFNRNQAGKNFATQELSKIQVLNEATEKESRNQREYFFKRYQGSVRAIQSQLSPSDLNKKHNEIESLFDQGLLPGTFVIEIHRQIVDFTKSRNEQELAAIESLAHFYALEGRLFEEKL